MNEKKKTQPQKGHYAQHREFVSLLFRFPKHKLLSFYIGMAVKIRNFWNEIAEIFFFFFYVQQSIFFIFVKIWTPVFTFHF